MIRTDIITETQLGNTLYILDDTPHVVEPKETITTVYVPMNKYNEYLELNPDCEIMQPYDYKMITVRKPEFYDQIAVIMTSESNPEVLSILYNAGLCTNADYMTLQEAKTVTNTNLGTIFRDSNIKHFEEFQYFTGITKLNDYAFWCAYDLEYMICPKTLVETGKAIWGVSSAGLSQGKHSKLKYVSGLNNVTKVTNNVFQFCDNLISVDFSEKLTTTTGLLISGAPKLETIGDLSGIQSTGGLIRGCSNLKAITLNYGNRASSCKSLSTINFDWENVTTLPSQFMGGDSTMATYMGEDGWRYGTAISVVPDMPNLTTATKDGKNTGIQFYFCRQLKKVGNMPKLTYISGGMFGNCNELREIGNMDSVTTIYSQGFTCCYNLEYAYFKNCTSVQYHAFYVDIDIEENRTIEFGKAYNQITWGEFPFLNCTKTTIICNGEELTAEQYTALGAIKPQ